MNRDQIEATLLKNRPKLSVSSRRTYTSLLFNLLHRLDKTMSDASTQPQPLIEHIMQNTDNKNGQKSLMSALFVATNNLAYRERMLQLQEQVRKEYAAGKLQPKESGRPSFESICARVDELQQAVQRNPTIQNYVDFITAAIMSGKYTPPRRNEVRMVKVRNISADDNYLDMKKNQIVYKNYKTAKQYGVQMQSIPAELMKIIKKFVKISDNDYLIFNPNTGKPYASFDMSRVLTRIFKSKLSVDTLRSIYVSHEMEGVDMKRLQNNAEQMGHSLATAAHVYNRG